MKMRKLSSEELDAIKYYDSKGNINFNAVAWEAPIHDGVVGFLPEDRFYNQICEWLKSLKTIYKVREGNVSTVRKSMEDSEYNVIATYNHTNKMISYVFKKFNEYEI